MLSNSSYYTRGFLPNDETTTLSITTLSIMTLSIMSLSIMTLSMMTPNAYVECLLR
jgi:hypothetical protein